MILAVQVSPRRGCGALNSFPNCALDMAADEVLLIAEHADCHFEIQEGRGEGYYVWRFVGAETVSTHDYLQDTVEQAKGCAFHQWNVPENAWRPPASPSESRLR
jgi:hypothetical protein